MGSRPTAFADRFHPRARTGLPCERPHRPGPWTSSCSTSTATTRPSRRPSRPPLGTAVGPADYDKLVGLLSEAFERNRAARLDACGSCLRRVRRRVADPGGEETSTTAPSRPRPGRYAEGRPAEYYEQALALASASRTSPASSSSPRGRASPRGLAVGVVDGRPRRACSGWPRRWTARPAAESRAVRAFQLVVRTSQLRFGTRAEARRGTFPGWPRCFLDCLSDIRAVVDLSRATKMVKRGLAEVDQAVEVTFAPATTPPGALPLPAEAAASGQPRARTVHDGPVSRALRGPPPVWARLASPSVPVLEAPRCARRPMRAPSARKNASAYQAGGTDADDAPMSTTASTIAA